MAIFELTTSPNAIWTDLAKVDPGARAPVLVLDPADTDLVGEVTQRFKPGEVRF